MELYSYEAEHLEKMRRIAPECTVLLRSNGKFPLDGPGKIALFGSGARKTLKGGTGSGDVNSRYFPSIEDALISGGFEITTSAWLNAYDRARETAHENFVNTIKAKARSLGVPALFIGMGAVMPEPEYDIPLDFEGEAAIYVLSRISGEGSDRNKIKGDILLTDSEIRDISSLNRKFKKFMLVLNVGGVVDLSPLSDVENILLLSQLGAVTGETLCDLLLGRAYPSGKLTATWSGAFDYCDIGDFGDENDTRYREGIYVGYRYFDSVGKSPLFAFGHGLGYTDFSLGSASVEIDGSRVRVSVPVSNIGDRPGRETVQVYVSVPEGRLDQPYQVLAAFAKTDELMPQSEQTAVASFDLKDLASFDKKSSSMILEGGKYAVRVGTSSANASPVAVIKLSRTVRLKKVGRLRGKADFEDWKPENKRKADIPEGLPTLKISRGAFYETADFRNTPMYSVSRNAFDTSVRAIRAKELISGFSDEQLARICIGKFENGTSASFVGASGKHVVGAAGETTDIFPNIPYVVMADGPAGLRLQQKYGVDSYGTFPIGNTVPEAIAEWVDEDIIKVMGLGGEIEKRVPARVEYQYCTAIPVGTAIAQSFDPEVARTCGDVVGEEMERFGVQIWLAPALNIQRDIRCGRNFEYASEDPLLSGIMSASITRGVQSHRGCGVAIKHFCCNNQETNRFRSNSILSERALREIYLRGFEVCVKNAEPVAVMTSYNLLNGKHTSEREDLIQGILRGEWGYGGLVVSDWITRLSKTPKKYPYTSTAKSIKAGNDLIMPGTEEDLREILDALKSGRLSHESLEACAINTVAAVLKLKRNNSLI